MQYRREIDGLRALAVLPVIFFHAGFSAFPGGYIGVDVFFVISGYLITTLILEGQRAGGFSLYDFYERRARRIIPALILVVAVTFPFGWIWLLPSDYLSYSKSLISVAFFSSNIFFWGESGYFDGAAELKPLLHTWSLAVEEQFYIFFPLLLIYFLKFSRRGLAFSLAGLAVLSFLLAQLGMSLNPSASFYLFPARAWELLAGALAAIFLQRSGELPRLAYLHEFLSILGLFLVVVPIFVFDKSTPYPGWRAIFPVSGSLLLIVFARGQAGIAKLLSNNILVGIGLISYSAYLWHQPLFSMFRHYVGSEFHLSLAIGLCATTFLFAYLSWRFVERPFRLKGEIHPKYLWVFVVVGLVSVASIGAAGVFFRGFPGRVPSQYRSVGELVRIEDLYKYYDYAGVLRHGVCHSVNTEVWERNGCLDFRRKNIFIWGDSYAASLYSGVEYVRNLRHSDYGITQLTDGNVPPFFIDAVNEEGKSLLAVNRRRLSMVERYQPAVVLLGWMIDGAQGLMEQSIATSELSLTIGKIRKVSPNTEVVVVGPFPKWSGTLAKQLIRVGGESRGLPPRYMWMGLDRKEFAWDARLARLFEDSNVKYISALSIFCSQSGCLTRTSENLLDITAVDWGHLTRGGSIFLAKAIEPQIFK